MPEESNIHPTIERTMDFSDKFSPMLVKELRQGLKGTSFIILFIALQAILALLIVGQSFAVSYDSIGDSISSAIFICLGLATCVIQPLRGISAVGGEIKENTIDLMVITRLSAWKIVYGKWISLVSQSALIIVAVSPYLILRYFFGGMQLFGELMVLLSMFIASAGFTALFIGISSFPSLILRGILGLACAFFIGKSVFGLFIDSRVYQDLLELMTFQFPEAIGVYALIVLFTAYIGWLALDFGAGYIAPISENRSTARRLITLAIVAILYAVFLFNDTDFKQAAPAFMIILSIPIAIISLTELPYTTATVSVPFVKKGFCGRLASFLFYPGWASGLNFVLLLFLLSIFSCFFYGPLRYYENYLEIMLTIVAASFSCLLFPLLIIRIFFKKTANMFVFYLASAIGLFILWMLISIIVEQTGSQELYKPIFWIPPIQFNMLNRETAALVAIPVFMFYWVSCFLTSRTAWKHVRENDLNARGIIESEKQFQTEEQT